MYNTLGRYYASKLVTSMSSPSGFGDYNYHRVYSFFGRNRHYGSHNLQRYSLLNSGKRQKAVFTRISDSDQASLKHSKCLVPLSIGKPAHEGANLAATLELVDQSFQSCVFVLGDTLQRHTIGITSQTLENDGLVRAYTKQQGDEWISNNVGMLKELDIPWAIMRWDTFLKDSDYSRLAKKVEEAYNSEGSYRQAFDDNIDQFISRVVRRGELLLPEDEARERCLRYLKEECIVMCMWIREGAGFELYADGRAPAMQATFERFIEPLNPNLLRPLALRFKKVRPTCEIEAKRQQEGKISEICRQEVFI